MRSRIKLAIIAIAALLAAQATEARVLNVPDEYRTIQAGIDSSRRGDTVLVAPGVYSEHLRISSAAITLASQFLATNDTSFIRRTVIDAAQQNASAISFRDTRANGTVVTGFTIKNASTDYGGGIYLRGVTATIRGVVIKDNHTTRNGGGIYCTSQASLTISDATITSNIADHGGGGVACLDQSTIRLTDVMIDSNRAVTYGGGLQVSSGAVAGLDSCSVWNNITSDGGGGGIYGYNHGNITVRNTSIVGNRSVSGPAVYAQNAHLSLDHLLITRNVATLQGGSTLDLMDMNAVRVAMTNLTMVRNQGVPIKSRISFSLRNFIIAEANLAPDLMSLPGCSVSYCDIVGGRDMVLGDGLAWGPGNIDADPQFSNLGEGDCSLRDGSPCLDAGDRMSPRDPDGSRADMGAIPLYQRDIRVEPRTILFTPIWWHELDSLPVAISNVGETDLRISSILNCEHVSCIFTAESPDTEIVVSPDSAYILWVYFRPDSQAAPERSIFITSDDPTDSLITIEASGDFPNGVTGDGRDARPTRLELLSAFPNPFNSSTTISYSLPATGWTEVDVVDIEGRRVSELARGRVNAGAHSVTWNAEGVPAGVYLVRVKAEDVRAVRKVVLVR